MASRAAFPIMTRARFSYETTSSVVDTMSAPFALDHRAMPLDTNLQKLVHGPCPPVIREDFDLGIAGKALRLDRRSHRCDVDDAIAHHAVVVENVLGRHQPVAD